MTHVGSPVGADSISNILPTSIKEIVKSTTPKFDETFSCNFQYTVNGRWHTIEINFHEYLEIIRSGMIDGKQITALEMWNMRFTNAKEETEEVKVIYDFVAKHTLNDPWRLA